LHIRAVCLAGKIKKDEVTFLPEGGGVDELLDFDEFDVVNIQFRS
jgi:hypothetical protein